MCFTVSTSSNMHHLSIIFDPSQLTGAVSPIKDSFYTRPPDQRFTVSKNNCCFLHRKKKNPKTLFILFFPQKHMDLDTRWLTDVFLAVLHLQMSLFLGKSSWTCSTRANQTRSSARTWLTLFDCIYVTDLWSRQKPGCCVLDKNNTTRFFLF